MLEQAMQGAADAGAAVEMVSLYDDAFKGCVSCFACKVKNAKTNGLCAYKDALTPILKKAIKHLTRAFPKLEVHPFKGLGHGEIMTQPERLVQELKAFMGR